MKKSIKTGFSFGLTSGIITTLGLIVGLSSGTHSKLVVVGGILTIAIADAFSDSLGIHISQESHKSNSVKQVWESTFATFFTKLFFALTFLIPVLLFELSTAVIISILWGLFILIIHNIILAKNRKVKAWKLVTEHVLIAILVVIMTYLVGRWIGLVFG